MVTNLLTLLSVDVRGDTVLAGEVFWASLAAEAAAARAASTSKQSVDEEPDLPEDPGRCQQPITMLLWLLKANKGWMIWD